MQWKQLTISKLPAWCSLNDISFHDVSVQDIGSKGHGIVTNRALPAEMNALDIPVLMMIPNSLILCRETIDEHSTLNRHFRELLEVAGGKVRAAKEFSFY